jgi:hypothetical protein
MDLKGQNGKKKITLGEKGDNGEEGDNRMKKMWTKEGTKLAKWNGESNKRGCQKDFRKCSRKGYCWSK